MERFIHLLYVPTMACNMQCRYCYLGDGTKAIATEHSPLETLAYAVEKCRSEGVMPFNISLHGGEDLGLACCHADGVYRRVLRYKR